MKIVFPAGVFAVSVDVSIIDDNIFEQDEIFQVTIDPISLPYGVNLGSNAAAEVKIMDDDCK